MRVCYHFPTLQKTVPRFYTNNYTWKWLFLGGSERKVRTKWRSQESTIYALYKIKEIPSSFLKVSSPIGIILRSSFEHFVSNLYSRNKGKRGVWLCRWHCLLTHWKYSENSRDNLFWSVINKFFWKIRNSLRNHAVTVHEFFQWQIWCSKLNSMPYRLVSWILSSRNLQWTIVVKIGSFESETHTSKRPV